MKKHRYNEIHVETFGHGDDGEKPLRKFVRYCGDVEIRCEVFDTGVCWCAFYINGRAVGGSQVHATPDESNNAIASRMITEILSWKDHREQFPKMVGLLEIGRSGPVIRVR